MTHDSHTPVIARLRQEPWQSHFLPQSALRLTAPSQREPLVGHARTSGGRTNRLPPRGGSLWDTHRISGDAKKAFPSRGRWPSAARSDEVEKKMDTSSVAFGDSFPSRGSLVRYDCTSGGRNMPSPSRGKAWRCAPRFRQAPSLLAFFRAPYYNETITFPQAGETPCDTMQAAVTSP